MLYFLVCDSGIKLPITEEQVKKCVTLFNLIETEPEDIELPVPFSEVQMIEILNLLNDLSYIEEYSISMICQLAKIADFLEIEDVLDALCMKVANYLDTKDNKAIRAIFGL